MGRNVVFFKRIKRILFQNEKNQIFGVSLGPNIRSLASQLFIVIFWHFSDTYSNHLAFLRPLSKI
jgi:hypothetical protein